MLTRYPASDPEYAECGVRRINGAQQDSGVGDDASRLVGDEWIEVHLGDLGQQLSQPSDSQHGGRHRVHVDTGERLRRGEAAQQLVAVDVGHQNEAAGALVDDVGVGATQTNTTSGPNDASPTTPTNSSRPAVAIGRTR